MVTDGSLEDTAPLSFQQQDVVRQVEQAPECAPLFHKVMLFKVLGELDEDALALALRDVLDHHPALRTMVLKDRGGPRQVVVASDKRFFGTSMYSGSVEALAAELDAHRREHNELFAPEPLFRMQVHKAGDGTLLSLAIHHLVFDGWSLGIFWRDLASSYRAVRTGRKIDLPALPMTYTEFTREQHRHWCENGYDITSFWKAEIAGRLDGPTWPPSTSAVPPNSLENGVRNLSLGKELSQRIGEKAKKGRVTPFLVLLTATAMAASSVMGKNDLLVGSNSANREDLRKRELIGYYTNTRLTRALVEPGGTFDDLLTSIRRYWLVGHRQRDAYIDRILESIGRPWLLKISMLDIPGVSQTPGSVFAQMQPRLDGAKLVPVTVHRDLLHWRDFDLTWSVGAGGFEATARHRLSRVDPETAAEICRRTTKVLTAAVG